MHEFFRLFLAPLLFIICTGCLATEGIAAKKVAPPAEYPQGKPVQPPVKPAATSGQTVNSDFFSVRLPAGWNMAYPLNRKPGGTSAVFTSEASQVTVTINILKSSFDAKKFVNIVWNDMKKSGLKPSAPHQEGKFYTIRFNGKPGGQAWFAANGSLCVATVILTPLADISSANAFLQAIKSRNRDLFPMQVK